MNFWEYLNGVGERRARRPRLLPCDFRGWLGLGLFSQSTFLFTLLAAFPQLQQSQGFMTLASAVIVTGWIGGAAAFAYSAGKRDADQSEQSKKVLDLAQGMMNDRAADRDGGAAG